MKRATFNVRTKNEVQWGEHGLYGFTRKRKKEGFAGNIHLAAIHNL